MALFDQLDSDASEMVNAYGYNSECEDNPSNHYAWFKWEVE